MNLKASTTKGLFTVLGRQALRAKIRPDEAESAGFGGSKFEDDVKSYGKTFA